MPWAPAAALVLLVGCVTAVLAGLEHWHQGTELHLSGQHRVDQSPQSWYTVLLQNSYFSWLVILGSKALNNQPCLHSLLSAVLSSVHHLGTHALWARVGKVVGNPVVNISPSLSIVLEGLEIPGCADPTLEGSIYRVPAPGAGLLPAGGAGTKQILLTPKAREEGKEQFVFTCHLCSTSSLLHSLFSELLPNAEHGCAQSSLPGWDGRVNP